MTALDFDSSTIGYAFEQGIKVSMLVVVRLYISDFYSNQEDILAMTRGLGAAAGIAGSIIYPWLCTKIGLTRTGLIAIGSELICLSLTVVSIWLPGSPFDPIGYFGQISNTTITNEFLSFNTTSYLSDQLLYLNNNTSIATPIVQSSSRSQISIWVMLVGILLSRCGMIYYLYKFVYLIAGLWMADLTINQIMQESIAEHERGAINGVQNSLNQLMSMNKELLVILLPDERTFGLLIVVSVSSIALGFISYCGYARKVYDSLIIFTANNINFRFTNRNRKRQDDF
jgi:iron-regulated transporter 1